MPEPIYKMAATKDALFVVTVTGRLRKYNKYYNYFQLTKETQISGIKDIKAHEKYIILKRFKIFVLDSDLKPIYELKRFPTYFTTKTSNEIIF